MNFIQHKWNRFKNQHIKWDFRNCGIPVSFALPSNSLVSLLLLILFCFITNSALASGTLIEASKRVDHIHDTKRNLIYISNGDSILRYDVAQLAMIEPLVLGGDLGGLDIPPNGDTLAVANRSFDPAATTNSIFLVDLVDGTSRTVAFTRAAGEGGTWSLVCEQQSNNRPVSVVFFNRVAEQK